MLKKTIKYTDFNDEEQERDFYFNLTKAELVRMDMNATTGDGDSLAKKIERIIASNNGKEIMQEFEGLILSSYGERTPDGRFEKSPEISSRFASTAAYSELFMELVTDANAGAAFINGLVPKDLADELRKSEGTALQVASEQALAQSARERSEAQMQGHKKKADHEGNDIQDVPPSLPSVPVDPKFPTVPLVTQTKPVEEMSREELIALAQGSTQ